MLTVVVPLGLGDGQVRAVEAFTPAAHSNHGDEGKEAEEDGQPYSQPCCRGADLLAVVDVVLVLEICESSRKAGT